MQPRHTFTDATMPKTPSYLWTILFWMYLFIVSTNTVVFFNPQSPIKLYYQILLGFNNIFLIPYLLNLLAIIFDLLAIIPFYNFLNPTKHRIGRKNISLKSWKWFLIIRFSLLFIGHAYTFKEMQAVLHSDPWITLAIFNLMLIFYAPSYFANFIFLYQHYHSRQ